MPMCDNHGKACGTRGMSFCTMIHEPTLSEIATFEAALLVPSESGEAQLEGAAGEAGVGGEGAGQAGEAAGEAGVGAQGAGQAGEAVVGAQGGGQVGDNAGVQAVAPIAPNEGGCT